MDIEQIILQYFKAVPSIISVTLFGSYARNTQTPESDIDIAILCDSAHIPDGFQLIEWREALSSLLFKDIDLVCLNTASPIIGMQIHQNGKTLLINDQRQYTNWQIRLFVDYAELKELRAPMEKNILKRKYYDKP